ncbi:MAG: sigma-54 dependent transcriptional regulator [Planctomycetes bacterium]|nr:sigma-54 dependent transcriptional regulator [Planctomycetota bacterium]
MARVLIIDDEPHVCWALKKALEQAGHEAETAPTAEQGLPLAAGKDLVFLDIGLPGMNGLEALSRLEGKPVVVITAHGTVENAVEALRRGAYDYLVKPLRAEEVPALVDRAVKRTALEREVARLRGQLSKGASPLKGATRVMQEVFKQIATVAMADAPVLVLGESGTGKELVARTIHAASRRAAGPFEPIDCGALPETLLDSELYGHERGAFTGAVERKRGRVELADKGTLFLDEIGELSPAAQAKLLRFLGEGEFVRVGGGERQRVDVRVVAATHRDLRRAVSEGTFREDLFYRLAVTEVRLPPLRERREDVPLLVAHFLEDLAYPGAMSEEAMAALGRHSWPGNVRELRNAVEAATVTARGGVILPDHLPQSVGEGPLPAPDEVRRVVVHLADAAPEGTKYEAVHDAFERAAVAHVLGLVGGNQVHASRLLGIHRTTLRKLIEKYRL